ncbi:23S rRNA pseudouridine2605 synthase [Lacibacter cauensis]|uniref:Pseudouridine synthase n=1 Tax=Lacibacter cauensis TaxID=510947 RepID=A0A562SIT9_9BACT|nr:pseudouridine synthase [Lacibacter cauensis]TWI81195.1 23S rRNA pseudouridine2605 synthase [Lacibacter cauensis]
MAKSNFGKFTGRKSNAQIKEEFRQEKKKAREEKNAYFEKKKAEERSLRPQGIKFKKQEPEDKAQGARHKTQGTRYSTQEPGNKKQGRFEKEAPGKPIKKVVKEDARFKMEKAPEPITFRKEKSDAAMPLNKYIAHCGVCSRRDAVELIKAEKVKINGTVVTEPGHKIEEGDTVIVNGKKIAIQKELVYILLNKPKDYITTSDDPQGRRTIMDLMKGIPMSRIYPVGRLDRNTTGVLLLTNDGELTQKLSHPSYQVKKVYEVTLDRPLEKGDFEKMMNGLTLEDGFIAPDALGYADPKNKKIIGIEIHSGRNRIVRRMFEHLGYDVKGLDRVLFANLTKKNVDRGRWRYLNEKEVRLLKFLNKSFVKKKEEKKGKNRDEE